MAADRQSAIIFSSSLLEQLQASRNHHRLPLTYVGVRRIRPITICDGDHHHLDDNDVADAAGKLKSSPSRKNNHNNDKLTTMPSYKSHPLPSSTMVFKVVDDDGIERRMTSKEKKEYKRKMNQVSKNSSSNHNHKKMRSSSWQSLLSPIIQSENNNDEHVRDHPETWDSSDDRQNQLDDNEMVRLADPSTTTACVDWSTSAMKTTATKTSTNKPPIRPSPVETTNDLCGEETTPITQMHMMSKDEISDSNDEKIDTGVDDDRFPPVLLPACMTRLALQEGILAIPCHGDEYGDVMKDPLDNLCHNQHNVIGTTTTSLVTELQGNHTTVADSQQKRKPTTAESSPFLFLLFDHDLSDQWAKQLKASMKAAEQVRQNDSLRPMPYQIVPEAWVRMRPDSLILPHQTTTTNTHSTTTTTLSSIITQPASNHQVSMVGAVATESGNTSSPLPIEEISNSSMNTCTIHQPEKKKQKHEERSFSAPQEKNHMDNLRVLASSSSLKSLSPSSWSFVTIRPPIACNYDHDQMDVMELLYTQTSFHFSCGAKFGCDFLLYDGPREERHAFAGLRILASSSSCRRTSEILTTGLPPSSKTVMSTAGTATTTSTIGDAASAPTNASTCDGCPENETLSALPIPTAYDMAGYVRGLNTAGKLALLATVVGSIDNEKNNNNHDHNDINRYHNQNHNLRRVAFVDLALEKVWSAPTHRRRHHPVRVTGTEMSRREVGQHLSKLK